jgi:hypothetical protein
MWCYNIVTYVVLFVTEACDYQVRRWATARVAPTFTGSINRTPTELGNQGRPY